MPEVAVPTAPALSSLRRVELIDTGDWKISNGFWKASRGDLVAAIAALDCPAVRNPVIKLGHSRDGEPLWAGNPTGEPAVGWIENLATTNQGHTLVGDLVGMPGWLGTPNTDGQTVIASAWPDRSVEGKYDFRCQLQHTHPFVLTALALLGVTRPGVGTLRSLQDVGRLYGVEANTGPGVEVVAHLPGKHDQSTHGRKKAPSLPDVGSPSRSRRSSGSRSRSTSTPDTPAKKVPRKRTTTTTADQAGTINRLTELNQRLRGIPMATRGTRGRRSLSREVRDLRTGVDAGEVAPEDVADRLETLAQRSDVQGDSRLEDLVFRAVNDLRGQGPGQPQTPDAPAEPDAPSPPSARDLGPLETGSRGDPLAPRPERTGPRGQDAVPGLWDYDSGEVSRGLEGLTDGQRQQVNEALSSWAFDKTGDEGATARIGSMLRGREAEDPELREHVEAIDAAFDASRTDRDLVIYRGFQSGAELLPDDWQSQDLAGLEWSDRSYVSFTDDLEGAEVYTGDADDRAFAIRAFLPEGSRALALGDPGGADDEGEILLPRDMRYRVIRDHGVQGDFGHRWLDVEIIPGEHDESLPDEPQTRVPETPDLPEEPPVRASAGRVQVQAAADVSTGAMVALLPAEEDAQRLAVDGGEGVDQLHMTLVFLGDADAYTPAVRRRMVAEIRNLAEVVPLGEVDGMALSAFNPHDPTKDTAIVLELGGDGLDDVQGMAQSAVEEVAARVGLVVPEQHSPYRPHLTLLYSDDLMNVARLADRAGPVRFDRIRVAFGGDNVDIPLSGEGSDLDVDNLTDDDMPVMAVGEVVAQQSRRVTRSDRPLRRYWLRGKGAAKIRWNTPGDWTRCVRQLRRHLRDPKGYCAVLHREATGVYPGDRRNVGRRNAAAPEQEAMTLPNPNPTIVHAAAQVSVDDVRTAYYRQADQRAWIREFHTEPKRLIVANDGDGTVARVDFEVTDDGQVRFGSPVPVRVEYVEDDEPEKVAASRMVYASAAESRPSIVTDGTVQAAEVSDKPWSDIDESDFTLEQLRRSALIVRGDGSTKEQLALPVREPDGTLNRNAVHAAAGGHGVGAVQGISEEERRTAARKLVRLYRSELDEDPPESLLELAGTSTAAAVPEPDPPKPPAAEPDHPTTEEDDMSLTEVRQRLGLADDADEAAVLAAVDALKTKADTAPDPTEVAAAAAEKDELTKEVGLLRGKVEAMSAKIADSEATKAAEVKASVLDTAQQEGKFAPAEREQWEQDYDAAPGAVTRVLASIAVGTAVPVNPQGKVGDPTDVAAAEPDDEDERIFRKLEPATVGATGEDN